MLSALTTYFVTSNFLISREGSQCVHTCREAVSELSWHFEACLRTLRYSISIRAWLSGTSLLLAKLDRDTLEVDLLVIGLHCLRALLLGRASEWGKLSRATLSVRGLPCTRVLVVVGESALSRDASLSITKVDFTIASKFFVTTTATRNDAIRMASRHSLRLVRQTRTLNVVSIEKKFFPFSDS